MKPSKRPLKLSENSLQLKELEETLLELHGELLVTITKIGAVSRELLRLNGVGQATVTDSVPSPRGMTIEEAEARIRANDFGQA